MVPPSSNRISRVPPYFSKITNNRISRTGLSPCFAQLSSWFRYLVHWIRLLGSSAFARRYSQNLGWFLFLEVLRCFSSLGFASSSLCIQLGIMGSLPLGLPIQTSSDQCLLPTPRCFSQAITSFFASDCQGIHRMRFLTWLYILKPADAPWWLKK